MTINLLAEISSTMARINRFRRRIRRLSLHVRLTTAVRIRRAVTQLRLLPSASRVLWNTIRLLLLFIIVVVSVFCLNRFHWHADSEALVASGTLPQLAIAVGAAMLGVIGIVFSLSIFSIQQVAERGTSYTLREYTRDWVFQAVYWALGIFAVVAILTALQNKEVAEYGICINCGIVVLSLVALKSYFNRAVKFVDPHFTIAQVSKRARKLLAKIERVENAFKAEIRLQRARSRR